MRKLEQSEILNDSMRWTEESSIDSYSSRWGLQS
jgi:serine/threonine protein kinase